MNSYDFGSSSIGGGLVDAPGAPVRYYRGSVVQPRPSPSVHRDRDRFVPRTSPKQRIYNNKNNFALDNYSNNYPYDHVLVRNLMDEIKVLKARVLILEKNSVASKSSEPPSSSPSSTPLFDFYEKFTNTAGYTGKTNSYNPESSNCSLFVKHGDVFNSTDVNIAHAVAADLQCTAGIALRVREQFGIPLCNSKSVKPGLVIPHEANNKVILNVVTKFESRHKFTQNKNQFLNNFVAGVYGLSKYCKENKISNISMPKIGTGIDQLNWNFVEYVIKRAFQSQQININVFCKLNKNPKSNWANTVAPVSSFTPNQVSTPVVAKKLVFDQASTSNVQSFVLPPNSSPSLHVTNFGLSFTSVPEIAPAASQVPPLVLTSPQVHSVPVQKDSTIATPPQLAYLPNAPPIMCPRATPARPAPVFSPVSEFIKKFTQHPPPMIVPHVRVNYVKQNTTASKHYVNKNKNSLVKSLSTIQPC
jgi:O-acetyl-ADP-ribose deacetylase (regulator of RNase III)